MRGGIHESRRSPPRPLPDSPNLEWLRKQAKRHLDEMRASNPAAKLADAQFDLASGTGSQAGGR